MQTFPDNSQILPEHRAVQDLKAVAKSIFTGKVLVEEKIKGVNKIVFGTMPDGKLCFKNGNLIYYNTKPAGQSYDTRVIGNLFDKLTTLQNTLPKGFNTGVSGLIGFGCVPSAIYNKQARNDFVLFDATIGGEYMSRTDLLELGAALDVDVAPLLLAGAVNLRDCEAALHQTSRYSNDDDPIAGLIVKNFNYYISGQRHGSTVLGIPLFAKLERTACDSMFRQKLITMLDEIELPDYVSKFGEPTLKHYAYAKAKMAGNLTGTNIDKDVETLSNTIREMLSNNGKLIGKQLYRLLAQDIMGIATRGIKDWYIEKKTEEDKKSGNVTVTYGSNAVN